MAYVTAKHLYCMDGSVIYAPVVVEIAKDEERFEREINGRMMIDGVLAELKAKYPDDMISLAAMRTVDDPEDGVERGDGSGADGSGADWGKRD